MSTWRSLLVDEGGSLRAMLCERAGASLTKHTHLCGALEYGVREVDDGRDDLGVVRAIDERQDDRADERVRLLRLQPGHARLQ